MEQREQDKQPQQDAQKSFAAAKGDQPPKGKIALPLPAVAPIGIHSRTSKNAKLPPIHAFLLTYNKLPKLRTWVRFPSPAP